MPITFDALIIAGESQTLEFKTSFDKATIESLVSFANTQGGVVLVGVKDNGDVQGVTLGKETLNEWLGQIKSTTSPSLIPDIDSQTINDKTVVTIKVSEFPVKPVSIRGRYYKRVASSNHQMGLSEIADLYMQSLQLSWDSYLAPSTSLDALSWNKVKKFIGQVNDSGRFGLEGELREALEKLKYIVNGKPTWAALLLFAQEPLRHHIHIGRFKTPSMIIDDRQFTDTLFEVVEKSMKFIVSHISVAFEFDGSIQRKERFVYPLPALREVLLNAVIHRNYTDASDIQIKIFDDKISIFSPGNFYGGISLADIESDNYRSSLRNKLIAEAFYLTGNIEKYGSGFIRIRKALIDYPEIDFEIKEFAGGIMVTLAQKQAEEYNGGVNGGVNGGGLTQDLAELLQLIKTQPGLKTTEIVVQIEKPKRTIERWLKQLKEDGLIEFRGAPKKGGYYLL